MNTKKLTFKEQVFSNDTWRWGVIFSIASIQLLISAIRLVILFSSASTVAASEVLLQELFVFLKNCLFIILIGWPLLAYYQHVWGVPNLVIKYKNTFFNKHLKWCCFIFLVSLSITYFLFLYGFQNAKLYSVIVFILGWIILDVLKSRLHKTEGPTQVFNLWEILYKVVTVFLAISFITVML